MSCCARSATYRSSRTIEVSCSIRNDRPVLPFGSIVNVYFGSIIRTWLPAIATWTRLDRPRASSATGRLCGLVLRHRNHGASERAVGLSQFIQNREVVGVGDR